MAPQMITVEEADHFLVDAAAAWQAAPEPVSLGEATGRVLAKDVLADRDLPPFDGVAMDGIAFSHAALSSEGLSRAAVALRVASTQAAGDAPHTLPDAQSCIEIMTGAALPHGCDTVVPYEQIEMRGGYAHLAAPGGVSPRQHIHARGSDTPKGATIMAAGSRIGPAQVAALASVGCHTVPVGRRPRVAILTTGNELVDVDADALPHQIRRSNGYALAAALTSRGHAPAHHEHVRDDADALGRAVMIALRRADVLLLTGGVSAGKFDLVPDVLAQAGVREVFHKIRQKPGKPLWFGTTDTGQAVFGLPGNPVSALVGTIRYVLPFLAALEGAALGGASIEGAAFKSASLKSAAPPPFFLDVPRLPKRNNDFTHYVLVARDGQRGTPVPSNGSGDFVSPLQSDGFVEIPPGMTEPGPARFYPWI